MKNSLIRIITESIGYALLAFTFLLAIVFPIFWLVLIAWIAKGIMEVDAMEDAGITMEQPISYIATWPAWFVAEKLDTGWDDEYLFHWKDEDEDD